MVRTIFRFQSARLAALCLSLVLADSGFAQGHRTHPNVRLQEPSAWSAAHQVVVPNARRHAFAPSAHQGALVEVTAVDVHVRLIGRVARTTLDVALFNPGTRQAEAELLLPVPDGAAVSSFAFEGAAAGPTATLLPAAEARHTYDAIVARLRDPGLLEFAGLAAVRSSVFPVPAQGRQRVRLVYEELLRADGERIDYVLPRTEALAIWVPWSFRVEVVSETPIVTVYSPTHRLVEESRAASRVVLAVRGESAREPGPFRFSALIGGNGFGASILACPDPDGPGGTFLLFASLGDAAGDVPEIPREVTLVLDRSGSMGGEKFEQARAAALQVLEGLRAGEHFRIIDYSEDVGAFRSGAVPKNAKTIAAARKYLAALGTGGGTNIGKALALALASPAPAGSLPVVLFLTDGLPTIGERSEVALREGALAANVHARRIFSFGVGDDVNAPLLDALATSSRAVSTYVRPSEDVEVAVGGIFKRLKGPRLADLELRVLGADGEPDHSLVRELLPQRLPDLFEDDQLVLLGRYTEPRAIKLELRGRTATGTRSFAIRADFRTADARNDFVPRLWAARRIAFLMDAVRQAGGDAASAQLAATDPRTKELTDEILRLSLRYGVLSEYTAFLALDGTNLGSWRELAADTNANVLERTQGARWGIAGVNQARNYGEQSAAAQVNLRNGYWTADDERAQVASVQPVAGGVALQRGSTWVEGRLVESLEGGALPEADEEIVLGSAAHGRLVDELVADGRAGLAALAGDVLFQHRGRTLWLRNQLPGTAPQGETGDATEPR